MGWLLLSLEPFLGGLGCGVLYFAFLVDFIPSLFILLYKSFVLLGFFMFTIVKLTFFNKIPLLKKKEREMY